MGDTIQYYIDYEFIVELRNLERGQSFFYKGLAFTVCDDPAPLRTSVICFQHEGSHIVRIPDDMRVRMVDVDTSINEWTGIDEPSEGQVPTAPVDTNSQDPKFAKVSDP